MSSEDDVDRSGTGRPLLIGGSIALGLGLVLAVVFGVLGLTGSSVHIGLLCAFLFGYAIATMGLTIVLQELVDNRLVSAIVCAASALLLAVLMLIKRDALDQLGLIVAALFVAYILWWAYQSFRGFRQHGR